VAFEVVFILEMAIARGAVMVLVGLSVVFFEPVVARKYLFAGLAVVVTLLEMVFKLFRVIEMLIAVLTIVVHWALNPVLLKTPLCEEVSATTEVVRGRISHVPVKGLLVNEVPVATVAEGHKVLCW
jgi:hypothetical protein